MTTHAIVCHDPTMYIGWPANHGGWQWGDEFLVGALEGPYSTKNSMHSIGTPFEKILLRSRDGGESWERQRDVPDFNAEVPTSAKVPAFSLNDNDTIIRVCGVYDHGGDNCYEGGAFYLSTDRGHTWAGPYPFIGIEGQAFMSGAFINTSRTAVLGPLVFLSRGHPTMWGLDETFCASHNGSHFAIRGMVCNDSARAVMPAVARVQTAIIATLRRRKSSRRSGWVEAFRSDDEGVSWRSVAHVDDTGERNGNPPALIALDDRTLVCTYGNRDACEMRYAVSNDTGASWHSATLRSGGRSDIGYPRLFKRSDDKLVCVYYWADELVPQQHIASTTFEV